MKMPLKTMLMILLVTACAASAAKWSDDYEEAQAQAKQENKFVLLDFSGSDWCGWCMKLEAEVFSKAKFKKFAEENLVCVLVDFPHKKPLPKKTAEQNDALAKKFGIKGYPTIIVLDPGGEKIAQTGYQEGGAEAYVPHLESLIAPHRKAKAEPPPAEPQGARTWTSQRGATVVAELVSRKDGWAELKKEDGGIVRIHMTDLSPADRKYLDSLP